MPPNTDVQELRHKLAKMKNKHTNLHLINERGEPLPQEVGCDGGIPPAS